MNSVDSHGHLTSKLDAVLIFDLDGTILSINSYRAWVLYLLAGRFQHLRMTARANLSMRAAVVLLKSKLFRWPHIRTKRVMQKLWTEAVIDGRERQALDLLVQSLAGRVRSNLSSLLAQLERDGADAVLTTAAAGEYAYAVAQRLGFRHVLATSKCTDEHWFDNSGDEKLKRTLAFLEQQRWHERKRIFFTDHISDLPLIRACDVAFWFGKVSDLDAVKRAAPEVRIVACEGLSDDGLMSILLSQVSDQRSRAC